MCIAEVVKGEATITGVWRRQVRPMEPRLDIERLADEIVHLVEAGAEDRRLKWHDTNTVTVLIGQIPSLSIGFKQTIAGRRSRFRPKLWSAMTAKGWVEEKAAYRYTRPAPADHFIAGESRQAATEPNLRRQGGPSYVSAPLFSCQQERAEDQ